MDDNMEQKFADIKEEFNALFGNPVELKETTEKFFDIILDELTLEIIFETHRSVKIGTDLEEEPVNDEDFQVSSTTDGDVRQQVKKSQDCTFPICNRTVVASRFAPHLEQCMGMGRKRSRNASRMLVNNNKEIETSFGGMASDDQDDADWNSGNKQKKKKNNNSRNKSKNSKKDRSSPSVNMSGE